MHTEQAFSIINFGFSFYIATLRNYGKMATSTARDFVLGRTQTTARPTAAAMSLI